MDTTIDLIDGRGKTVLRLSAAGDITVPLLHALLAPSPLTTHSSVRFEAHRAASTLAELLLPLGDPVAHDHETQGNYIAVRCSRPSNVGLCVPLVGLDGPLGAFAPPSRLLEQAEDHHKVVDLRRQIASMRAELVELEHAANLAERQR